MCHYTEDVQEKERNEMAMIDWHEFVVWSSYDCSREWFTEM